MAGLGISPGGVVKWTLLAFACLISLCLMACPCDGKPNGKSNARNLMFFLALRPNNEFLVKRIKVVDTCLKKSTYELPRILYVSLSHNFHFDCAQMSQKHLDSFAISASVPVLSRILEFPLEKPDIYQLQVATK